MVQNLNQSFAEITANEGHRYFITDPSSEAPSKARRTSVETITRAKFLDRIEDLMARTRGRELPGTFNPMIISDLFLEQSQDWEALVRSHVEKVMQLVKVFLKGLIKNHKF